MSLEVEEEDQEDLYIQPKDILKRFSNSTDQGVHLALAESGDTGHHRMSTLPAILNRRTRDPLMECRDGLNQILRKQCRGDLHLFKLLTTQFLQMQEDEIKRRELTYIKVNVCS